jgi:ribonuclease BN (tRNA processing enzyme)
MPHGIDRRQALLRTALAAAALWPRPSRVRAQAAGTKLILLGTGGGPRPRKASSAPAQVIVINGMSYVVDCGNGVARQLVSAGLALTTVRHVFLTHQHSDHNADYGNLLWLAWASGLRTRVDTWGPPPLQKMTRLFFEMNAYDIDTRISDEGRVPLAPLVHVHELRQGGLVMQDEHMKVTAALVNHPPVVPAFGYRFDGRDRSIVISGDTRPTDAIVKACNGCDILFHEVFGVAFGPQGPVGGAQAGHTSAAELGEIARRANPKLLVLYHQAFGYSKDELLQEIGRPV